MLDRSFADLFGIESLLREGRVGSQHLEFTGRVDEAPGNVPLAPMFAKALFHNGASALAVVRIAEVKRSAYFEIVRNLEQLQDAIWAGDFGFVCEERYQAVDFDAYASAARPHFDSDLANSGKLPALGAVPIASWFLARVARLAGRRFPYFYGQIVGSDGGEFWIRFFCLTKAGLPLGTLSCFGSDQGIRLFLSLLQPADGTGVLDAFAQALLKDPADVARCRLVVRKDVEADPEYGLVPHVYGWNGRRFLSGSSPENEPDNAIDPVEDE